MKGNNIILIGFMGSGKTSVGRHLSKHLNYDFKDTDEMIVSQENTPIQDIFSLHGEAYFRDLETKLLVSVKDSLALTVLSTGGGMPVRNENRNILKNMGQVVYLRASAATITDRLSGDKSRPLLKEGNINEKVERLLNERKTFYEEAADIIIDTDRKPVEEIAKEIIKRLDGFR